MQTTKQNTYLLIGLALADLLAAIDSNAVTIALPKIADQFSVGVANISLVNLLYTAGLILSLIPLGRRGDSVGHKKSFLSGGLILFGLSSLLIAVTPSYYLLLFLRLIQGVSAGILYTSSGALIAKHWQKTELAFGVTAAFLSIGMLLGPIVGGILTDHTFAGIPGWRIIFLINVPFIIASYFLTKKNATETEAHAVKHWKEYLPNLELFKNANFRTISLYTTACMFCLPAVSFISSFYLQDVLALDATNAGLYLIPIPIGMAVFSVISGGFRNWKIGTFIGGFLITLGLILLSYVSPEVSYFKGLFWGYLIISAGAGFMFTNTFAVALGSVKSSVTGLASGYINTVQQVGSFAGVGFVASFNLVDNYQGLYLVLAIFGFIAVFASLFIHNLSHE